ncbi:MAG TPA: G1 family glutamic endopeptidase, partial [Acidimicrobiales bacterium]|nr:G1 family glutamic endopeptidase [Acidimicrobiales bacterium]
KGTWVVPTIVRKSGTALSSQWVGIDGDGNHDLIQTGTQAVLADGQKGYGAWWEILPAPETSINHTVRPGDVMTATIVKDHHGWHITLRDRNRWTFEITRHYTGPGGSIEWIVEAPTIGNQIAPMLHTTPVTFWGEQLNNKAPHLLAKNAIQCVQHGVAVETPSLANSKQAFTMAYGGRPPPPPR